MAALDTSTFGKPRIQGLSQLNARLWIVVLMALGFAVGGWLQPEPELRVGYWAVCAATLGAALAVRALFIVRAWRRRAAGQAVLAFIQHDAAACFATSEEGLVTFQNSAALARLGPQDGVSIGLALAGFLANPDSLIMRLRALALAQGAAREDMLHPQGRVRISVHQIADGLLWRIEDLAEPTTGPGAAISVPMMRLSSNDTIAQINPALLATLGKRPRALVDILEPQSLRSGAVVSINGAEEKLLAQLFVSELEDGAREVYLFPTAAEGVSSSVDPIFDSLPVPLLHLDAQGGVLRASRMAVSMLPSLQTEPKSLSQMFEGLGRPINDWIADAAKGRGLNRAEVVRVTGASSEQYLQVTLGRVLIEGSASLVAVLNDATELKTLEAQFVQSQKMQAIGQLAGGVAHDFNNLLTAISGHCDLLLLRHDSSDSDYADLVQINQNANRAAALVGQLLAFSRKQTLQPERLDLRDTLAELTHLLNRLVGEKISLSLSSDPGLLPIRADRRQLEQVLMNLVVNARDAMAGGGVIRIETQCDYLAADVRRDRVVVPAGQYVVVRVIDTGCGIPPDEITHIFEPFWTTKRPGEGTGLGLSMAYGIVKQTGGFIFADSEQGKGTEFSLYFPADDSVEQPRMAAVAPPPSHAPAPPDEVPASAPPRLTSGSDQDRDGVILLVEDEAPVRAFASRALQLRGYTVLEAACGEDALETLADSDLKIDLFVTDVMMPGMDGPTWVREALKTRPGIKTVFVSGYAQTTFAEDRENIPNSVFLPKPFSLAELTRTVHQQLVD